MPDLVSVRRPSGSSRYQAPEARYSRSQFDLTHTHKTTFDVGELIPYFVQEVIPGDTMTCRLMALARIFSPLLSPVMDNIEVGIDFFFVPNRLIWTNWEAFLGAHDQAGAQDTVYTTPRVADGYSSLGAGTFGHEKLRQYMGIPEGLSTTQEAINALPFRAYALIYNEWYRDQNLINSIVIPTGDGPDAGNFVGLLKSAKRHDYFTSCLPYLQKGTAQSVAFDDTSIEIKAPTGVGVGNTISVYSDNVSAYRLLDSGAAQVDLSATLGSQSTNLYADLSQTNLTINALRQAAAIQRLLERDARGGTRHPELIKAHFGVMVPDYRTQRPEYLGGGQGWINISPVANTSGVDATVSISGSDEPQGELRGTGSGVLTASWAKSFVEHGWVLGIVRARGQVTYQQGLERKWSRSTKYDYLWPELAGLGEQSVLNKELWYEGDSTDDNVFGYQERYADYRYAKSLVTGKFQSDVSGAIDHWHLAEDFSAQPTLGQTFIEDATPMARIQAVTTEPDFIIDGRFDFRVARVLPVRPLPSLISPRF